MPITFTVSEISDISFKILEMEQISSALEESIKFSNESFNLALIEIIKHITKTFVLLYSSSKKEMFHELTKEQVLAEITNSYNVMKAYEAEFII